jgi:hypothetical protein
MTGTYAWIDLTTGKPIPLAPLLRMTGLTSPTLTLDPEDSSRLIAKTARSLAILDFQTDRTRILATTTLQASFLDVLASSRTRLAWVTFDSKKNLSEVAALEEDNNSIGLRRELLRGRTVELAWSSNNTLGILQDDGTLYLYEPGTPSVQARANDVTSFAFTEDGSMLVALERRSVEVFSLTGSDYSRLNIPDVEHVKNIAWYKDKQHLLVQYPEKISLVSLDDRSLENIQTVTESPQNFYSTKENSLYFIQNKNLFRLDFAE